MKTKLPVSKLTRTVVARMHALCASEDPRVAGGLAERSEMTREDLSELFGLNEQSTRPAKNVFCDSELAEQKALSDIRSALYAN